MTIFSTLFQAPLSSPERCSSRVTPLATPSRATRGGLKRLAAALTLSALALSATGCQFNQQDIESWAALEDKGAKRLAGYVLDTERPEELRLRSFELLVQHRHFDHILSLAEQLPASDRPLLLKATIDLATRYSQSQASTSQQSTSVDLLYFMLSFPWAEEALKREEALMTWMTTWSLSIIKTEQKSPSVVNPDRILIASLLVGGEPCRKLVEEQFQASIGDAKTIVSMHNILFTMKDPKLEEMMAGALLETARKLYPDELKPPLVDVMVKNGNRTLLKYLIEVAKDNQAPQATQELAIDKASAMLIALATGDDQMKAEVAELFKRVLSSKVASAPVIFYTLRRMWDLGGTELLTDALKAINPEFRVPVSGADLRLDVESFCEVNVGSDKDNARLPLQELIDELGANDERWPAKLYAISCIHSLYPDDFPRFLKAKGRFNRYYKRDKTVIRAWHSDRNTTLGEIVQELLNPLSR